MATNFTNNICTTRIIATKNNDISIDTTKIIISDTGPRAATTGCNLVPAPPPARGSFS